MNMALSGQHAHCAFLADSDAFMFRCVTDAQTYGSKWPKADGRFSSILPLVGTFVHRSLAKRPR